VIMLGVMTLALLLVLGLIFTLSSLAPKGRLAAYVAAALLVPLFALWAFLANGYRHSTWWPFQYGSLVPHLLAGLVSLVLLIVVFLRATGSLADKLVVGSLACGLWLVIWVCGTLTVACGMGDCF
jgi:hypothetical protein